MPLSAGPSGGMLAKILGSVMEQGGQGSPLYEIERKKREQGQPAPNQPPAPFDQGAQMPLGQVPKRGMPPPAMQPQGSGGVLPAQVLQQLMMKLMGQPPSLEPQMQNMQIPPDLSSLGRR